MLVHFTKQKRKTAISLLLIYAAQMVLPSALSALTEGPSQPEALQFQPAGMPEMVDLSSGDMSYNIPVMDVGGFPLNMAYSAGIGMDDEATWTGLGWNLNIGAINRSLRGIPDDFKGDEIVKNFTVKDDVTVSGSVDVDLEVFGIEVIPKVGTQTNSLKIGANASYNNYTGWNLGTSLSPSLKIVKTNGTDFTAGLGIQASGDGLSVAPSVGLGKRNKDRGTRIGGNAGLNFNSRQGLVNTTLSGSFSGEKHVKLSKKPENKGSLKLGSNGSATMATGYGTRSYSPILALPFTTEAMDLRVKLGPGVFGADITMDTRVALSKQSLNSRQTTSPAFGYIFAEKGQHDENATHDFIREKDGGFTENTPNLPVAVSQHDLFSIQAQGLGGTFHAQRNDIGFVYDRKVQNNSIAGSLGLEFGGGNAADIGIDIAGTVGNSKTGKWTEGDGNVPSARFKFTANQPGQLRENVHFKMLGETSANQEEDFYTKLHGEQPLAFKIDNGAQLRFIDGDGNEKDFTTKTAKTKREVRQTNIECLSVKEFRALDPVRAKRYLPNASHVKDHHIAQITVLKPDGTRYVFGLPAYNLVQKELTFNVSGNKDANGNVNYSSQEKSTNNEAGLSDKFEETITPAYVYTWYLTEVFSPDYIDRTGDGPTLDDVGAFTMINYGMSSNNNNGVRTPDIAAFKWRTPMDKLDKKAKYQGNLRTVNSGNQLMNDDEGNIVYGEKDIWYAKEIISRSNVAILEMGDATAPRKDGYEALSIDGGIGQRNMKCLKKINLYDYETWSSSSFNSATSVPLKTVVFNYSHELCKGTPNSKDTDGGKLTLKSLYFTFQNSGLSKFSPYNFTYNHNPNYNPLALDRWGTYKANNSALPNEDFPYATQNKATRDVDVAAWSLTRIETPSGSKIDVTYESDDYQWVQNHRAARMFTVLGTGQNVSDYIAPDNNLFKNGLLDHGPKQYLFFRLDATNPSDISSYFEGEEYGPRKHLYFKFLMNINAGGNPQYEYVNGYVDVDGGYGTGYGMTNDPNNNIGWLKIRNVELKGLLDKQASPISKAAWQFSKLNTPYYAYNLPTPQGGSFIEDFARLLTNANIITQFTKMIIGQNRLMRDDGFGRAFVPEKSWVRLLEPDSTKLGGGLRVKKITVDNDWSNMTSSVEAGKTYEVSYDYRDNDGKSSGVASWEPSIGADENLNRQPVFFNKENLLVPDEKSYQELPYGESVYPSPGIVYGSVKVSQNNDPAGARNGTGYTVNEFYTAKDFPTETIMTPVQMSPRSMDPVFSILKLFLHDERMVSQGVTILLNDMAGKPKREATHNQAGSLMSEKNYIYNTTEDGRLNNKVAVVNDKGEVIDAQTVGVDFDFICDARHHNSWVLNGQIPTNIDFMMFGIFPFVMGLVFPPFNYEEHDFKCVTSTKIIHKRGLLKRVVAKDLGAEVETENIAFDAMTGEALVTRVNNEYQDYRYGVNYPTHWAYDRMGHASKNYGFVMDSVGTNPRVPVFDRATGRLASAAMVNLVPGDELLVGNQINGKDEVDLDPIDIRNGIALGSGFNAHSYKSRVWVMEHQFPDPPITIPPTPRTPPMYYLVDKDGKLFKPTYNNKLRFKVIRSGRKNTLGGSVQSFETAIAPFSTTGTKKLEVNESKMILNASAKEYSEIWRIPQNSVLKRVDGIGVAQCSLVLNCFGKQVETVLTTLSSQYNLGATGIQQFTTNGNNDCLGSMATWTIRQTRTLAAPNYGYTNVWGNIVNPYQYAPSLSYISTPNRDLYHTLGLHFIVRPTTNPTVNQNPSECNIVCLNQIGNVSNATSFAGDWENFKSLTFIGSYTADPSVNPARPLTPSTWGATMANIHFGGHKANYCVNDFNSYSSKNNIFFSGYHSNGNSYLLMLTRLNSGAPIDIEQAAFKSCSPETIVCYGAVNDTLNPYLSGHLGRWREVKGYTPMAVRSDGTTLAGSTGANLQGEVNLRKSGHLMGGSTQLQALWQFVSNAWGVQGTQVYNSLDNAIAGKWNWTAQTSEYSQHGMAVEEMDKLGNYSAVQNGYKGAVPMLVAKNANLKEIGFDGFEDYYSGQVNTPFCFTEHFRFELLPSSGTNPYAKLTDLRAHTGWNSLEFKGEAYARAPLTSTTLTPKRTLSQYPFKVSNADILSRFEPTAGTAAKNYRVSFWVRDKNFVRSTIDYADVAPFARLKNPANMGTTVATFTATEVTKGPLIEGWQQITAVFPVVLGSYSYVPILEVGVSSSDASKSYFMDDFKIVPDAAQSKSFVYDNKNLRLMAEFDDQHYATFYEYDEEGHMIRVKKETERGIVTLSENRNHSNKKEPAN